MASAINIILAIGTIGLFSLSLYLIIQGKRKENNKMRNTGLGIFLAANVVVVMLAQTVLMDENRESVYNLDFIRDTEQAEGELNYDTARIVFLDLVSSPIPDYINDLEADALGDDPFEMARLEYNCPYKIYRDMMMGLPSYFPSTSDTGAIGFFTFVSDTVYRDQNDYLSGMMGLESWPIRDSVAFCHVSSPAVNHYLAIDSSTGQVTHLAIRK